jgi:hypothetical protein
MELVDGETLADWLRAEPRSVDDIVATFVAAGRGLAAAHVAGLVHRDFKPHNVLRSRDGRILVTDFGLARGVDAPIQAALEVTMRPDPNTPSPLSGITATGSVLGTPAYMAPEQWGGKPVGPAADQFGFCVALWEALTGERPFKGETIEELRKLIDRGVASLDVSKLPRRLRAPLSRGLDPDPARRFPKIDALLDALAPPRRRQLLPIAIGATLAMGAVAVYAVAADRAVEPAAAACPAPARDASSGWSPALASPLVSAGHPELARAMQRDVDAWHAIRGGACVGDPAKALELTCLDGVLARADAVRRAAATLHGDLGSDALLEALVDPAVCAQDALPRLAIAPTPDVVEAFAIAAEARRPATKLAAQQAFAVADRNGLDPCARGIALLGAVSIAKGTAKRTAADAAVDAAEQCRDDRLRAEALLTDAPYHYEVPLVGPKGLDAIKKAQTAVARVAQADLIAGLDLQRAYVARQQSHWQEALDATAHASAGFAARGDKHDQLGTVLAECEVRGERSEVADMEGLRGLVTTWRPVAIALGDRDVESALERVDARARIALGDLEGGHDALMRHWREHAADRDDDDAPKRAIEGVVVDHDGKPVAGASVATASTLVTDSIGAAPLGADRNMRIATTDAGGHFAIPNAPEHGAVMAQKGELRSSPSAIDGKLRLVLEPTRRLAGKVDLRSRARTKTIITVEPFGRTDRYRIIAPIRADGSFDVAGVPTARVQIGTATEEGEAANLEFTLVEAGGSKTDLALAVTVSDRSVDVVARSAVALPLEAAQILLFPGRLRLNEVADLIQQIKLGGVQVQFGRLLVGEQVPKAAIQHVHTGDLVAHFTNVRDGELTACAIGLNGDLTDPAVERKLQAHLNELRFKCDPVGKSDRVVVVEAPPQKRFD